MKTAQLLREQCRVCGFVQAQMSQKLNINQSQVSRILSGKFKRRSRAFNALCKLLDVKPVFRGASFSLSSYPDLNACLAEILDGSRERERAVVRMLTSARKLS